jgi:hypothetical protein
MMDSRKVDNSSLQKQLALEREHYQRLKSLSKRRASGLPKTENTGAKEKEK